MVDDIWSADGEQKVVVRWRWQAHHTGHFRGLAATGMAIELPGIAIYEIRGDKASRRWVQGDRLALILSLGFKIVPPG